MSSRATIRQLVPGDEPAADAFLREHLRSSILLLSNLKKAGLTYDGRPFQGTYVGAFQGSALIAIAAHYWSGNLVLQAPDTAPQVAEAALKASGRSLRGLLGPWEQVTAVRKELALDARPTHRAGKEVLYELDLDDLIAPEVLSRNEVICRRAEQRDFSELIEMGAEERVERGLFRYPGCPRAHSRIQ